MAVLVALSLGAVLLGVREIVRDSVTQGTAARFQTQSESLDNLVTLFLQDRTGEVQAFAVSDLIRRAVAQKNSEYAGAPDDILADIKQLDDLWTSGVGNEALIERVTSRVDGTNPAAYELAEFLSVFELHRELIVTDSHGATVAATGRLSDYYQADEEWWQAAWKGGAGAVYISDRKSVV